VLCKNMRTFPSQLNPGNISLLREFRRNRQLCYLRRHVYEAMLSPSFSIPDNCGINLQNVNMGGLPASGYSVDQELVDQICSELGKRGFETNRGYGGTVLFVYTPGNTPRESVTCSGFD